MIWKMILVILLLVVYSCQWGVEFEEKKEALPESWWIERDIVNNAYRWCQPDVQFRAGFYCPSDNYKEKWQAVNAAAHFDRYEKRKKAAKWIKEPETDTEAKE